MAELSFGEWLKRRREAEGWTQEHLAQSIYCSTSALRKFESEERRPSVEVVEQLAHFFNIPPEELQSFLYFARGNGQAFASGPEETQGRVSKAGQQSNLPFSITSFIGRKREQSDVIRLLTKHRLVTLTGSGGVGKTRLSLKVGEKIVGDYLNGVWLVEFAPILDPSLVPHTTALTLGLREDPQRSIIDMLCDYLHEKRLLLILDNCEHVLDACAELIDSVLKACPQLKILVTSREALNIAGEAIYRVPSLGLPNLKQIIESFRTSESIQLFEERAQLVQFDFSLTEENIASVAQICQRLDGIPLAIELAAAKVGVLSPTQIAKQLGESLNLLTGGSRTALPRHQTLRASMNWSWSLLTEAEQRLMRQLSVFAGGWMLEAAQSVCDGDVMHLLNSLVTKSLIVINQRPENSARYSFHEIIHEYAVEKLMASGEADEVRQRHAKHYLAFAEASAPTVTVQFDRLELEQDNLRAGLSWSLSARGAAELGLRLVNVMARFWSWHQHWTEGSYWMERALAHADMEGVGATQARAWALVSLALAYNVAKHAASEALLIQSLSIFQELGDISSSAEVINHLGWLARERGDTATARMRLEESIALYRKLGDKLHLTAPLLVLAEVAVMENDAKLATTLVEEVLALERQTGNTNAFTLGWALNHLGHAAQLQGDWERARQLHEQSLVPFNEVGRNSGQIWAHQSLGETALGQKDSTLAMKHFREALEMCRDWGARAVMSWCIAGLAGVAAVNEEPERAAWLWGAAEALRQSIGVREAPAARANHEQLQSKARKQLGEAQFNTKWAEGQVASVEQVIADVQGQ